MWNLSPKCAASDQMSSSFSILFAAFVKLHENKLHNEITGFYILKLLFFRCGERGFVVDGQISASALQWHRGQHCCSEEASKVRKSTCGWVAFVLCLLVIFVLKRSSFGIYWALLYSSAGWRSGNFVQTEKREKIRKTRNEKTTAMVRNNLLMSSSFGLV